MNGIVTKLPEFIKYEVESIWNLFKVKLNMERIMSTSFAHITWVIANCCDEERVNEVLEKFGRTKTPFVVKTNGIGIFTGKRPAMYIQIKPDIEMLNFQNELFGLFSPYAYRMKKNYRKEVWIPHISLATEDLSTENITAAVKWILHKSLKYDIRIDSFSLVRKEKNKDMEVVNRYNLHRTHNE